GARWPVTARRTPPLGRRNGRPASAAVADPAGEPGPFPSPRRVPPGARLAPAALVLHFLHPRPPGGAGRLVHGAGEVGDGGGDRAAAVVGVDLFRPAVHAGGEGDAGEVGDVLRAVRLAVGVAVGEVEEAGVPELVGEGGDPLGRDGVGDLARDADVAFAEVAD